MKRQDKGINDMRRRQRTTGTIVIVIRKPRPCRPIDNVQGVFKK